MKKTGSVPSDREKKHEARSREKDMDTPLGELGDP
jgi:hypothetical protein